MQQAACFSAMAAGLAVVFLGVVLMHDLKRRPWLDWLLPTVLLLGLLLLACIVGEVLKMRVSTVVYRSPGGASSSQYVIVAFLPGMDGQLEQNGIFLLFLLVPWFEIVTER
jgi:hypothetical protein